VLADHVYVDSRTGKKIIAGTFNELAAPEFPSVFTGSAHVYLCLTDLRGRCRMTLEYIDLAKNKTLLSLEHIHVYAGSPLESIELIVELPDLPLPHPGSFAIEVCIGDELLGSLRLLVSEGEGSMMLEEEMESDHEHGVDLEEEYDEDYEDEYEDDDYEEEEEYY
jgi:hypothetical protein